MCSPNTVTILNTGKTMKNEFFILNTPGKNTKNSMHKDIKIQNYEVFFNVTTSVTLPNFIRNSLPHALLHTEALLERYRQEHCPNFPSRLSSLFVFDNFQDVLNYKNACYPNQESRIYKVHVKSNDYKITQHNMEYVSMLRTTYGFEIYDIIIHENILGRYWSGEASPIDYSKYGSNNGIIQPTFEYLIEGEFFLTLYDGD